MKDWNYIVIERDGKKYIVDTLEYTYRYLLLHFAWLLPVKAYLYDGELNVLSYDKNGEQSNQAFNEYIKWGPITAPLGIIISRFLRKYERTFDVDPKISLLILIIIISIMLISFNKYYINKRKKDGIVISTDCYIFTKLSCPSNMIYKFVIVDLFLIFLLYCCYIFIIKTSFIRVILILLMLLLFVLSVGSQWYYLK